MKNGGSVTHVDEIDHLRGIAITLTLLAHFAFMQGSISQIYLHIVNSVAQFWGGVHLFFVVSGYVISRSFMSCFEKDNAPARAHFVLEWKRFYARRFFRIVPTAMTWVCITFFCAIFFNEHGSFGAFRSVVIQSLAASAFVYNAFTPWIAGAAYGIYWSLSFEEQFYLFFPMFSRKSEKFKLIALVAVILIFTHIHRPANQNLIMVSFPLDAICWGVLISMLQRNGSLSRFEPVFLKNARRRSANLLVSIAGIIFSPILFRDYAFGTSVLIFSGAWLVFCASFDKGYVRPDGIFNPIMRKIGIVSFSVYCTHMPSYLLAREISMAVGASYQLAPIAQNFISFGIAASFCALFTTLSVKLVEQPSRRYGRRYAAEAFKAPILQESAA